MFNPSINKVKERPLLLQGRVNDEITASEIKSCPAVRANVSHLWMLSG